MYITVSKGLGIFDDIEIVDFFLKPNPLYSDPFLKDFFNFCVEFEYVEYARIV